VYCSHLTDEADAQLSGVFEALFYLAGNLVGEVFSIGVIDNLAIDQYSDFLAVLQGKGLSYTYMASGDFLYMT